MSRTLFPCAALLCSLSTGCAVGDAIELSHDGLTRNYYLHVPHDVRAGAPLVMGLHGGGRASTNKGRRLGASTGLADLADAEGFVAVFPSSLEGNWNDGRAIDAQLISEDTDDVGFLAAVVAEVEERAGTDPNRVYVTGDSNGGLMTQRLLCERPDLFAAGQSVIATMPEGLACEPSRPVGVQFVLGTEDPLMPWEGGDVGEGDRGRVISADAAVAFWAGVNGCEGEPTREDLPDLDPGDDTTATHERWQGCLAPLERVVIHGGGHGRPGGSQYLPKRVIGAVSQDVQSEDLFWSFVQDLALPAGN